MSDAFLTLAQTERGLSCFLLPRIRPDGSRNAFRIQRLKTKLGNRSNASSEVEFAGAYAQLLGEEGRGVRSIIDMVHHTRLDCVSGSAGLMRRALAEALHHTRHRQAFGKRLWEQPLMRSVLADLARERGRHRADCCAWPATKRRRATPASAPSRESHRGRQVRGGSARRDDVERGRASAATATWRSGARVCTARRGQCDLGGSGKRDLLDVRARRASPSACPPLFELRAARAPTRAWTRRVASGRLARASRRVAPVARGWSSGSPGDPGLAAGAWRARGGGRRFCATRHRDAAARASARGAGLRHVRHSERATP